MKRLTFKMWDHVCRSQSYIHGFPKPRFTTFLSFNGEMDRNGSVLPTFRLLNKQTRSPFKGVLKRLEPTCDDALHKTD